MQNLVLIVIVPSTSVSNKQSNKNFIKHCWDENKSRRVIISQKLSEIWSKIEVLLGSEIGICMSDWIC